ncbi:hypothetical protein ACFY2M_44650 [Streptomyces sp. NPDC001276]|uniref:hypothetical protein n=1 Tax=Streptomyces sp. NPDC001276 TaxID=3364555 RepID=UPI003692269F
MTDQQAPSADPDGDAPDRPLTLAVLRHLVRKDWSRLPDDTLVVLSVTSKATVSRRSPPTAVPGTRRSATATWSVRSTCSPRSWSRTRTCASCTPMASPTPLALVFLLR